MAYSDLSGRFKKLRNEGKLCVRCDNISQPDGEIYCFDCKSEFDAPLPTTSDVGQEIINGFQEETDGYLYGRFGD